MKGTILPARITSNPERMAAMRAAVNSGLSLNEIQRSLGIDYRTVKKHFPDYKPFEVGGGGDAAVIRETNRQLTEFLRRGKIGKNRDSGFKPKEA